MHPAAALSRGFGCGYKWSFVSVEKVMVLSFPLSFLSLLTFSPDALWNIGGDFSFIFLSFASWGLISANHGCPFTSCFLYWFR
jgi:hypothetical protein